MSVELYYDIDELMVTAQEDALRQAYYEELIRREASGIDRETWKKWFDMWNPNRDKGEEA